MAFDQSARDPNALKRELEAALLASQQITGTLIAAVAGAPNRTMVRVALERAIAPCKPCVLVRGRQWESLWGSAFCIGWIFLMLWCRCLPNR